MNLIDTTRHPLLLCFLSGGLLLAGSLSVAQSSGQSPGQPPALPATPPTAAKPASAATPTAATAAAPVAAKPPAAQRAEVVYSDGQLSIVADNSSLNQILRDIARKTAMKITGGVADQRVFGKYGPGPPAQILADLLDGADTNILLRESPSHVPEELVLTPRNGDPTPPSPDASASDDAPPSSRVQAPGQAAPPSQPAQPPQQPSAAQTQPTPAFVSPPTIAPSSFPATAPQNAPNATSASPGASNPQSPNGVGTPQQIFQQQQQMQQQSTGR